MPATVTLSTTTLTGGVSPSSDTVVLASTSGIFIGYRLFVDSELMQVLRFDVDGTKVRRGVDGTASAAHASGSTVYIGQAHQFYSQDPVGRPASAIPVSPWINISNGSIWYAQGDALPEGDSNRWWQRTSFSYSIGPLGVRTTTLEPTSST